ncbi:hypothetical protein ACU4GD_24370 [Cupriavidus basilensis]
MRRVALASASAAAAPEPEITITDNGHGVVNSETVVARVEAVLQSGLGKDKVARTLLSRPARILQNTAARVCLRCSFLWACF